MFVCTLCTRSFARKDTLIRHVRLHRDPVHWSCDICDCKFTRKDNLDRHIKYKHGMYLIKYLYIGYK